MNFFTLKTPRDMLEKAHRELGRLLNDFNIDNLFNFFVTVYHIQDYIKNTNAVPARTLQTFLRVSDVQAARDMCEKGKHLHLTKRKYPATNRRIIGGSNTFPLNALPIGGIRVVWTIHTGNRTLDVSQLAQRVMKKWDDFFSTHNL
jgi:hypothetical protein